jgi:HD-GYP domain-containing protein (c-di-GMP phosphodiesterase class II)
VTDTRALLNRMAQFRRRLEELPRLGPAADAATKVATPSVPPLTDRPEPGSKTQAILGESVRRLDGAMAPAPPALVGGARRLLADAQGLVARLRAVADDPMFAGLVVEETADPLAVHHRETTSLTEAAVRYAMTFPPGAEEQGRLCEGLEGMIDAARRRLDVVCGILERRRSETERVDRLARFLSAMVEGDGPLDPEPVIELAETILAEEPGRPLRFISAGRPNLPARFVASHGLSCANVLVRVAQADSDWHDQARDLVLAGLIHDVGMVSVGLPNHSEPLDDARREAIKGHAKLGAERILRRLPSLGHLAEVAACHHERTDGSGYPDGLRGEQLSPMVRLVAAVDVYAAMCAPRPHRPAHDPRTALTDVLLMAEHGRLDRYAADRLLVLGLYPTGTVVELADGSTAVVLAARDPRDSADPARPVVAMLADPDVRPYSTPRVVDLAAAGDNIVVRTLRPAERLRRLGRSYPEWAC